MAKKRALNTGPKSTVAQIRKNYYAFTWNKINEAIEDKYFLEAITLCESIICDRLEARIGWITSQSERKFKTLGENKNILLGRTKSRETDSDAIKLYQEINKWRISRNHALHEMVKLEESSSDIWENKYSLTEKIANDGVEFARKLSNQIKKLNK